MAVRYQTMWAPHGINYKQEIDTLNEELEAGWEIVDWHPIISDGMRWDVFLVKLEIQPNPEPSNSSVGVGRKPESEQFGNIGT